VECLESTCKSNFKDATSCKDICKHKRKRKLSLGSRPTCLQWIWIAFYQFWDLTQVIYPSFNCAIIIKPFPLVHINKEKCRSDKGVNSLKPCFSMLVNNGIGSCSGIQSWFEIGTPIIGFFGKLFLLHLV
jgi:hypothetical protein